MFVSPSSEPQAKPSETAESLVKIDVPAEAMTEQFRTVELALPQSIELVEGERLVVAVQLAATADLSSMLCLRACFDTAEADVDWWSNRAVEPFAWEDLVADIQFDANLSIHAIGKQG